MKNRQNMQDYKTIVARVSYRILCEHSDSTYVTSKVITWLSKKPFSSERGEYESVLRKTSYISALILVKRSFADVLKIRRKPYEIIKPDVDDIDDYQYKLALELFMRASDRMTLLQRLTFSLHSLEELPFTTISTILHISPKRVRLSYGRALETIKTELRVFDRESDLDRYIFYIRKVTSYVKA